MTHSQYKSFLMDYGTPKHQDDVVKTIANSPVMDRTWDDNATLEDAIKTGKRSYINHVLNSEHVDTNSIHHIVKHGTDQDRSDFINHESPYVRSDIAHFGNDVHRDKLVDDPSHMVRKMVAVHGNDSHRDKLVHDKSNHVESAVHIYGNDSHRKIIDDRNDARIKNDMDRYGR